MEELIVVGFVMQGLNILQSAEVALMMHSTVSHLRLALHRCLGLQPALHQLCGASQEADGHPGAQPCYRLIPYCQLRPCAAAMALWLFLGGPQHLQDRSQWQSGGSSAPSSCLSKISICPRVANRTALKRATVARGAAMPLKSPRTPSCCNVCTGNHMYLMVSGFFRQICFLDELDGI